MEIHAASRGTYGVPRIHAELAADGVAVGRKRVSRLMRRAGIEGISRRGRAWTTRRDRDARPAPDLVERDFGAPGADQLWVADIPYVPTWAGFLYLAVVVDAWSRRVVGWAMANHLRTELVLDALNMALGQRRATGVIHHSDQGCQYTSIAFGLRCREAGVQPSMGSVGDCYDNAMCESFFATLECELLDRVRFRTQSEARIAIFDFIEGFYNPRRRHSAISRRSSSSVRRQPEPGFARVDPLRGRVSEQLQERDQRQSIMSARGRSQALRCPSKRGSSIQQDQVRALGLRSSELLPICPPGSRHLRGLNFTKRAWSDMAASGARVYLFDPNQNRISKAASKYISDGEERGVHEAYKCRVRTPWWRVPRVGVPDLFFTYMNRDTPRLISNKARVPYLNSIHGVFLKKKAS